MKIRSWMAAACLAAAMAPALHAAEYVLAISIDGMGADYVEPMLADGLLPNLQRLRDTGATTLNARTDADFAITLPNHTAMVTGRGVLGPHGHHWVKNSDPDPGVNLAINRGGYTASMFDVAHDHGLSTALWSGKSKFSLYVDSFDHDSGADDTTGEDNGRNKIDYWYIQNVPPDQLTDDVIERMTSSPVNLAFIHYRDPDSAGHAHGWGTQPYRDALIAVDASVGRLLDMILHHPQLAGRTAVIVTADHGGHRKRHGDMDDQRDYVIPFLVWGEGVAPGDLYDLNRNTRKDPERACPIYADAGQPIRNGEMGNLALTLLGLPAIPGSTIDAAQDLATAPQPEPEAEPEPKAGPGPAEMSKPEPPKASPSEPATPAAAPTP